MIKTGKNGGWIHLHTSEQSYLYVLSNTVNKQLINYRKRVGKSTVITDRQTHPSSTTKTILSERILEKMSHREEKFHKMAANQQCPTLHPIKRLEISKAMIKDSKWSRSVVDHKNELHKVTSPPVE